jgi:serine/threonine protein kinase
MKKIVRENRVMRRITADPPDIYRHPGISASAWDLITRILTRDPAQRLTLAEIRQHPFFQLGTAAHVGPAPAGSISSANTDIMIPTQPDALIDQVRAPKHEVYSGLHLDFIYPLDSLGYY